ncbi:MAG: M28 family metallopeptidase, partial [Bacteroidota bacterium]
MKSVLSVLFFAFCFSSNAQNLVLSKSFQPESRTIYNGSSFFISVSDKLNDDATLISSNIDFSDNRYFLVHLSDINPAESVGILKKQATVLYSDLKIAIVSTNKNETLKPLPDVHSSLVALNLNNDFKLSDNQKLVIPVDTFPSVYTMVSMVDTGLFMPTIVTLSAIPSRECITAGCATAQNIIDNKFQTLGFTTTLQPVNIGQPAQSNVIAIQTGTVHPTEYVVVGAHYDTYSFSGNSPGADDDASGVAGVIELARILRNYNFERTIVYCAFTAEEYGLYGSEEYAAQCDNNNLNIQGYFNFDMIGYLEPGYPVNTDMIYPSSALPLANFYKAVSAIFVPTLAT